MRFSALQWILHIPRSVDNHHFRTTTVHTYYMLSWNKELGVTYTWWFIPQVFPGTLLPHTYPDPDNPERLLGRSEVERRADYILLLHQQLREQHPLLQLVCQCLHNEPAQRPSAEELLQQLDAVRPQIEGTYGSKQVKVEMARLQVTMMSVLRTRETNSEVEHLQCDPQQLQVKTSVFFL